MERHLTLTVANGNKYSLHISLHCNIVSLKVSTKRISNSNGRFDGARNAYRQQGEEIRRVSKNMKSSSINFVTTRKELSDRVDKNWLNMKDGTKKKGRQESAQSYMKKLAKEAAKVDSLIADWTRGSHGHIPHILFAVNRVDGTT